MTELDDHSIRIIADSYPGDFAVYRVEQGKLAPLFASAGLPELSGMSAQEYEKLTGEDAAAVIMEADRPEVARRITALLKSGEDADFAYRIVHKQLGHIWIHAQGRLIGTSQGAPVILVSFSRSSSEAAGQSKLLNLTSTIMYVIQKDSYEILYANDCALDLWGHGDFAGAKCYQYVNGCSAPCPWCSIPQMKDGACHADAAYTPPQDKWFAIDCR